MNAISYSMNYRIYYQRFYVQQKAFSFHSSAWLDMGLSKLEKNVEILKILALNGPLKNSKVAYELKVHFDETRINLSFLVKYGLVECNASNQRNVYSITHRGIIVLKYFKELKQEFPIDKEIIS